MDLKNLFSKKNADASAEPKTIKDYLGLIVTIVIIIIFLLFYFFLIRPTFKKQEALICCTFLGKSSIKMAGLL